MNKLLVLVVVLILVGAASWAQTTTVRFDVSSAYYIPVYEVVSEFSGGGRYTSNEGGGSFFGTGVQMVPAFMASSTIAIPNGWHQFRIMNDPFAWFDLIADGTPQTWMINYNRPFNCFRGYRWEAVPL
jgi:hypothetical protein